MRPRVEGQGIDGADYSLRARGSNRLAPAPVGTSAYFAARERRILLIHGYNVEERGGQESMAALRDALTEGCPALAQQILTMTWPGNESWWTGGPAAYFAKVPVACDAGRLLHDAVVADSRLGMGTRELVIVAHSLGCRLTLEFLSHLERSSRPPELKKVLVILMAAAVPVHLDRLIDAARANADGIVVLHSIEDKVLRRWFKLGQTVAREGRFPEAVGHAGNPHEPPWANHRRMHGYDHGDYWTSRATADFIGEQLGVFFPGIAYRRVHPRASAIEERPMLDEIAHLPDYSLLNF